MLSPFLNVYRKLQCFGFYPVQGKIFKEKVPGNDQTSENSLSYHTSSKMLLGVCCAWIFFKLPELKAPP